MTLAVLGIATAISILDNGIGIIGVDEIPMLILDFYVWRKGGLPI